MAKIILLDFDGVIHSYKSGWQGIDVIPDRPVDGMIEWIEEFIMRYCTPPESICAMASEGEYELYIYSSRSKSWSGIEAMKRWLVKYGLDKRFLSVIGFPKKKPPAYLTIDDRAICFDGDVNSLTEKIFNFKTWQQKKNKETKP